jgi:hypothetical protein
MFYDPAYFIGRSVKTTFIFMETTSYFVDIYIYIYIYIYNRIIGCYEGFITFLQEISQLQPSVNLKNGTLIV